MSQSSDRRTRFGQLAFSRIPLLCGAMQPLRSDVKFLALNVDGRYDLRNVFSTFAPKSSLAFVDLKLVTVGDAQVAQDACAFLKSCTRKPP